MYWKFHSRHSWVSPLFTCRKSQWTKTEYIQNKDVLLIHWTETWRSKEKQEVTHFLSRIFIRWLEVIQDQMWVPHLVWLWGDLWNFVFSHITLISDLLVTRVKTNQLKLIDLFLQLQEKKKSDKRDKKKTKKDKRKTCHNINNTATSLFLRNRNFFHEIEHWASK